MRGIKVKQLKKRVLQYMKDHKIDMRIFKFNYRRVKKAYVRGDYAI